MKNLYIYSYTSGSNGAAELANTLQISRIKHSKSKFKGSADKMVINWGSSKLPEEVMLCNILNKTQYVLNASNKLSFFKSMIHESVTDAPRLPAWTSNKADANGWLHDSIVVARTVLTGHSGHGIIIVEPGQELCDAPLYTKYIFKTHEFRVHIVKGQIIDTQRKVRDKNREPTDWKVRSHDNGFIYVRQGFTTPSDVTTESLKAFVASGLDFGAVDIVYDQRINKAYVLEINTAPGLEGTTIESYANAFKGLLNA